MHTYAIPMRWADLDSLNHVNNVVYLDYAAESRACLVDDGLLSGSAAIGAITVRFVRPLQLGRRPVVVASSIAGDTLTQQICVDGEAEQVVHAEIVTRHGEPDQAEAFADVHTLPATVRRADLDAAGHVTPTKVFELFQEARVLSVATRLSALGAGAFVVGTSEVVLHRPIRWRSEPYVAGVRVGRVGRASFEIDSQLSDETGVLASSRSVLVGFDPQTQRSRPFDDRQREQLTAAMR